LSNLNLSLSSLGEAQGAILPPNPAYRAPVYSHGMHSPAPMEDFQFDRVTVSEGADKFPLSNEKQGERERKRERLTPLLLSAMIFLTPQRNTAQLPLIKLHNAFTALYEALSLHPLCIFLNDQ